MGFPVPVLLPVGLIVLVVVADEDGQGEAVVGGDKVGGRHGPAPRVPVQVRGAREPGGEFAQGGRFAAPKVPHCVPEFAVPLGPLRREVAHLIAAETQIPRLRNQFGQGDNGILLHHFKERRQLVHIIKFPGQRRRQIKAKAVHVHLGHPVPQ